MRIVTWNMNAAFRGDEHPSSWDWLIETLKPDLVLAQEAVKPDHLQSHGGFIDEANPRYRWGSWVVAANARIAVEPVPAVPLGQYVLPPALAVSHPGAMSVANVVSPIGEKFVAVSIYGLMDNTGDGRTRHATTSLHRILSDLMPVFEASVPIILAGDLNITDQPMKSDPGGWWHKQDVTVFERLNSLGMASVTGLDQFDRGDRAPGCTCGLGEACRHVRTIRHGNDPASTPYQDDWIFVSESILDRVIGGKAVHDKAAWQRSDHCPLVLEVDL